MTHMPTNGGLVQPAEAVGEVAREAGIFFLLDATQTVGQIPLDVRRLGCHALAGTSRKYLRGPRGVGFLWVARDWIERLEPPLMEGHAAEWVEPERYVIRPDAKRFEVWESNVAARLGFGAAIEYAQALGLERIWTRVQALAETLRTRLAAVPGVSVRARGGVRRPPAVQERAALDGDPVLLADRVLRILPPGTGQPLGLWPLHGRAAEGRPGGHHAGGLRRLRLALAGRAAALERGRSLRSRARRGGGRQLALIVAALLGLLAAPAPACERARGAADAPVALILSGGGAKGAWEAGVAAALVERGLPVRLVAGPSAGALNAAMVADGRLDRLQDLWRTVTREQVYTLRPSVVLAGMHTGRLAVHAPARSRP